jgi:hypothetical protein
MSRFANVRGKHAPRDRRIEPVQPDLAQRQAYYKECFERCKHHYGVAEIETALEVYRETIGLHRAEAAARKAAIHAGELENYRWHVAPSLALRAARALEQAAAKRRELLDLCRELALRCVEEKFGAEPSHDTAVTEGDGLPPFLRPREEQPEVPELEEELVPASG